MEALWALGRLVRGDRGLRTMSYDSDSDESSASSSAVERMSGMVYPRHRWFRAPTPGGGSGRRGSGARSLLSLGRADQPATSQIYLVAHQRRSSLGALPADALQRVLHFLTQHDLVRSMGVSREWRALLEEDEALNRIFWQREVALYQDRAPIMQRAHVRDRFCGDRLPPSVPESVLFCMLRLKKVSEVAERRRYYDRVARGVEPPARRSHRCLYTLCRLFLLDALHGRDWGLAIPAGIIIQGALIALRASLDVPGLFTWWVTPAIAAGLVWAWVSVVDAVLLAGTMCLAPWRKLNSLLWQSRWVTVSRHPTLNRAALCPLSLLCLIAGGLVCWRLDSPGDAPPWHMVFIPLYSGCAIIAAVLFAELRMQRSIYFDLDAGYNFVEPDVLSEAEKQQNQTWRLLVWPRLILLIFGALFLVLLLHRLEPFPGLASPLPWSLVFVPMYLTCAMLFAFTYRFRRFSARRRNRRVTQICVLVCMTVFFLLLGADLDVSESLDLSEWVLPLWAACIPLWAAALAVAVAPLGNAR